MNEREAAFEFLRRRAYYWLVTHWRLKSIERNWTRYDRILWRRECD